MVVLYHYTTKSSLNGIKADKVIYQSTRKQRDAVLGPGVYLTSLNPNIIVLNVICGVRGKITLFTLKSPKSYELPRSKFFSILIC